MGVYGPMAVIEGPPSDVIVDPGEDPVVIANPLTDFKDSVRVATTTNITLSGEQTIDEIAVVADDRVLVKDQTDGEDNGIYVASAGAWTRAEDADTSAEVGSGLLLYVDEGTENGGHIYTLSTLDPITLDTTELVFSRVVLTSTPFVNKQVTAASYTFIASDNGRCIRGNRATAQTFTVPNGTLPNGAEILVLNWGAGLITFTGGATINSEFGLTMPRQYSMALLKKIQGNTWSLSLVTPTTASQAEMEAGTEAALRLMSPLRVKQAIDALGGGAAGNGLGWIDVKADHGAAGDGVRLAGAMTASDATLVVTTASFVSGDVGKLISVRGAGAAGVELITTIASFTNSTTVELTATASTTVSGEAVYYGTDDTTEIQAAIDAAEAAGGGTIYFPAGIYMVGGALQDTGGANSQLLLPVVEALTDTPLAIAFVGEHPPYKTLSVARQIIAPTGGSIIKGMLNTGTGALLAGYNDTHPNDFTNVSFFARDITVRLPNNPTLLGLGLGKTSSVELDNVTVDTGRYGEDATEPTTSTSFGIRLPRTNNGAWSVLRGVTVAGFYNGIDCFEHADIDNSQFWYCKNAIVFSEAEYYASRIGRVLVVNCEVAVAVNGAHHFDIEQLAIEHYNTAINGAKWYEPLNDLEDASNFGKGRITYHLVEAGTGIVNGDFTKNGGTGVVCSPVSASPLVSNNTGISGADQIANVVSLTAAEYGAITPNNTTLYIITDA